MKIDVEDFVPGTSEVSLPDIASKAIRELTVGQLLRQTYGLEVGSRLPPARRKKPRRHGRAIKVRLNF